MVTLIQSPETPRFSDYNFKINPATNKPDEYVDEYEFPQKFAEAANKFGLPRLADFLENHMGCTGHKVATSIAKKTGHEHLTADDLQKFIGNNDPIKFLTKVLWMKAAYDAAVIAAKGDEGKTIDYQMRNLSRLSEQDFNIAFGSEIKNCK
jgi:hypothetical protein